METHRRFQPALRALSSSWLKLAESIFADLTKRRLRRGTVPSLDHLLKAIIDYLQQRNGDPMPSASTGSVDNIRAKPCGCASRQALIAPAFPTIPQSFERADYTPSRCPPPPPPRIDCDIFADVRCGPRCSPSQLGLPSQPSTSPCATYPRCAPTAGARRR